MSTDPKVPRDRTTRLPVVAVAAMVIAYLLAFAVLGYTYMTARLEVVGTQTGTNLALVQVTAVISIVVALSACAAAAASRRTAVVVGILLATAPFGLVSIATIGIAFYSR